MHGSPPEITRRPVVLSTTAESIKSFQDNAAEVVLVRCTDQSDLGMTQDGLPVPVLHDEPVVQRVVIRRSERTTPGASGRSPPQTGAVAVLVKNIVHVQAGGDPDAYLPSEKALVACMSHCSERVGASTPGTSLHSFPDLLSVPLRTRT